jgi:hypothetical protein
MPAPSAPKKIICVHGREQLEESTDVKQAKIPGAEWPGRYREIGVDRVPRGNVSNTFSYAEARAGQCVSDTYKVIEVGSEEDKQLTPWIALVIQRAAYTATHEGGGPATGTEDAPMGPTDPQRADAIHLMAEAIGTVSMRTGTPVLKRSKEEQQATGIAAIKVCYGQLDRLIDQTKQRAKTELMPSWARTAIERARGQGGGWTRVTGNSMVERVGAEGRRKRETWVEGPDGEAYKGVPTRCWPERLRYLVAVKINEYDIVTAIIGTRVRRDRKGTAFKYAHTEERWASTEQWCTYVIPGARYELHTAREDFWPKDGVLRIWAHTDRYTHAHGARRVRERAAALRGDPRGATRTGGGVRGEAVARSSGLRSAVSAAARGTARGMARGTARRMARRRHGEVRGQDAGPD